MTDATPPTAAASDFLTRVPSGASIMVAVSGGSDSTGLLVALHQALRERPGLGIKLSAATVDHRLRPEAADEAWAVAALCARLGIPHLLRAWKAEKPASALSEAAREARYELLADMADEAGADLVVTAHTADDQAETIAMRAARNPAASNAGLAGIADAMLFDRRLWVFRPFLICRRADIRAMLEAMSIGWSDDPSNDDDGYERVRVRRSLAERPPAVTDNCDAAARSQVSVAAAGVAEQYLTVLANVVAFLPWEARSSDREPLRYLVGVLAAILGGRAFMPPSTSLDAIVDTYRAEGRGRWSAGRVLFDFRRDGLYMLRERRDLPQICVPVGASRVWDGRFRVTNLGCREVSVKAAGKEHGVPAAFANLPRQIAQEASIVLPEVAGPADASFSIESILSPFDRFLPGFDCILANTLAIHFGRGPYAGSPVKG
ncbi:tRNA lysidine(34) synthetase TilS [Rhizobium sp. PAMB 3182]